MAGDWIKFEHATLDKPEVLVLADYLETTPDDVIGKLLRVWVWFDKNSVSGDACGVTDVTLMKFIDRLVDRQGFAACLKKVGWLGTDGLPNFDRHNGETAKKRALTSRRTKKWRDDSVTQTPSPEKRREEVKEGGPKPARPDLEFIFTDGLDSLLAGGLSEREARAVLGRMVKEFGEADAAAALQASIGKADVKSYALAILTKKKRDAKAEKRFVI